MLIQDCNKPQKIKAKRGEAKQLLLDLVANPPDCCVLWPFAKMPIGYGKIKFNGESKLSHRLAFELYSGTTIPLDRDCAHNTDCISKSCFNPKHVRNASKSENMMDRHAEGTMIVGSDSNFSKLTEEDVIKIRADKRTNKLISNDYPVETEQIRRIKKRERWAWLC